MNRARDLPALSDAQLEVMQQVWSRGEATVTDVWKAISSQRVVARNTVLTVIDRLEKKGWLSRRAVANTHFYKATVTQRKTMSHLIQNLATTAFQGATSSLIVAMLENTKLSDKELDTIAALIEEKKKSG